MRLLTIAGAAAGLLVVSAAQANLPPPEGGFGPGFTVMSDDNDRPVVEMVRTDSPAAEAGIEPGYHILAIAGLDALMMPIWSVTRNLYGLEGTTLTVIVSDQAGNVSVHELVRSIEQ